MTRRRFYAPLESIEGGFITLSDEESRHLRDVLRLKPGDEAFVFDGQGTEYACLITETGHGKLPTRLEVRGQAAPPSLESPLALTLAVVLLKSDKFDLVVQKATELGVVRIIPVASARADIRLRDEVESARRVKRWQRVALEACKQSGRAWVPVIESPNSISNLLESTRNEDERVMFAERQGHGLTEVLKGNAPSSMIALVGPEGGWETDEIGQAETAGWRIVTLGGRTMRAETAAITVVALLQHLFGDLR